MRSTFAVFASAVEASIKGYAGEAGGGYCHIWAIKLCAAVKGMVFEQFTLGSGI